ncbi:MAG: DMT family transporter [Phormidesmis sp.]
MKMSDIAELLLLAALWGGSFLFMRIAAPVLGPVWLIEIRVLLAGVALLPLLIKRSLLKEMRQQAVPLLVVGCINSAIPFLLLAFASISLPAGFTSILNATAPLFGTVIATVWIKESLSFSRMIGFALGFAGVVVLIGWKSFSAEAAFPAAVIAGLSGALMYAIAAPYIKQKMTGVPSLVVTTGSQLGAAVAILPFLPFTVPTQSPSASIIFSVVALALFCTSFAYILYFRLIQNIGATRALTVAYLVPISAMLWGSLVLGEAITASMVLGCCLILSGTAIANDLLRNRTQS